MDRNRLYRLLAVGQKAIGMDDDGFRLLLQRHGATEKGGHISRTTMRLDQLSAALEELKEKGFVIKGGKKSKGKPRNFNRLPEYVTKVEALLADMGLPWRYADTVARNITGGHGHHGADPGVERLAWVKDPVHWRGIIAALAAEQEKRGLYGNVRAMLDKLELTEGYVDDLVATLENPPTNWRRHRPTLRKLVKHLMAKCDREEIEL